MTTLNPDIAVTLQLFFDYVDTNKDGFITVDEIRAACAVDVNADGTITESEIVTGAAPWLEKFASQDYNGDQKISLQELLQYNS